VQDQRLKSAGDITTFYRQFGERVSAVPSVTSVSYSSGMPAAGAFSGIPLTIVGRPVGDRSQRPSARFNQVSPDYFETLGIRITRGRTFTEADRIGTMPVAIVNETFVKRYLADVDPLTQRVVIEQFDPGVTNLGPGIERQIVDVSGDVRNVGPASESLPEIDVPFAQSTWARNWIAVRTAGDPLAVHQPIAAVVRSIDPDLGSDDGTPAGLSPEGPPDWRSRTPCKEDSCHETDRALHSPHGARTVTGGTPFGFNDRSDAHPFGTFKNVENGGKFVVMGDGMVSLYMTSWEGVQVYQCQEFMQDVFRWLLK
jgi:hypothetical protein